MKKNRVALTLTLGVVMAFAVLVYSSATGTDVRAVGPSTATTAAFQRAVSVGSAAKKESNAQKLKKALAKCKKQYKSKKSKKSKKAKKSELKACEKKARKRFPTKPSSSVKTTTTGATTGATTTGTTATGTTATGTTATTGTTGTATGTTGAATGTTGAATGTTGAATGTTGAATGTTGVATGTTGAATGTTGATVDPEKEKEEAKDATTTPVEALVTAGKKIFDTDCEGCHGVTGQGESGDGYVALSELPRAQSIEGVIDQLIEPEGGMPSFDEGLSFAEKEEVADYVCVDITEKCVTQH